MPVPNLLGKYGIEPEAKKKSGVPDLIGTKYNNFKATTTEPVVPPAKPGFFADENVGGIIKNTITGLPKALWNTLGPGKIQDYLNTPEGQDAAYNLTAGDVAKNVIPEAVKVLAAPVVDVAGIVQGPKEYDVFGTKIKNIQQTTKESVEAGSSPFEAVVNAVPQAIFDGLSLYGVAAKTFMGRPSPITKTGPVQTRGQFPAETPAKTGRLYQPETYQQGVPREVFNKITTENNIPVRGSYNPKNPVFFETTKVQATGESIGQFYQIKPSYFEMFKNAFKGDPLQLPPIAKEPVATVKPMVGEQVQPTTPVVPPKAPVVPEQAPIIPKAPVVPPRVPTEIVKSPVTPTAPIVEAPIAPVTEAPVAPIVDPKLKVIMEGIKAKNGPETISLVSTPLSPATQKEQVAGTIQGTPKEVIKPIVEGVKPSLTIKAAEPTKAKESQKDSKGEVIIEGKPLVEIGGKIRKAPEQLVTKSEVKEMLKGLGKDSVNFTVTEEKNVRFKDEYGSTKYPENVKYLTYKQGETNIKLRPSALGLVEDNIKVGQTVNINANDLKPKGSAMRGVNEEGDVEASIANDISNIQPARTTEEMIQRIEQLNKFGQAYNILRKTGGVSKRAFGHFKGKGGSLGPRGNRGIVELRDNTVLSPAQYMSTLAHELGHALEHSLMGKTNVNTFGVFGRNLTNVQIATLKNELKAVTQDLVGRELADSKPGYYYKNTELFARFLEKMFVSPSNLTELAPTAMDMFSKSAVENPIIGEYIDAVNGTIDKGERKNIFLRDMKQTYIKELGTRVGTMAWNDEVRYRAMKERAKILIEKLVNDKFKGVEDAPELLFQAAESIKVTKDGKPEFGTRDFQYAQTEKEMAALEETGYKAVKDSVGDQLYEVFGGKEYARYAKPRYTEEQGKALYEQLSPEGKKLINDFTASKEDALDYFNREVVKDVNKINSNIEGWVHHFWDDRPISGGGGKRLQTRITGARKERTGASGYVEDLQKAMTKALTELETDKAYNAFIEDWFSRITKPIAKGQTPDDGWEEVSGNIKKGGVGTPQEVRTMIIKDGEAFPANKARYQMPKVIYERYKKIKELADEASTAVQVMNNLNRYWRVNILFHPGSAATNFISGGIQYSTKVLTDFYTEALTGNMSFPQTRKDVYSMLTVLSPKGWQDAPDWVTGGDLSNFYGQFTKEQTPGIKALESSVDAYADKALKIYGAVERYWKKVIATSEGVSDLKGLNTITKEGLRIPTEMEKEVLNFVNNEVDLFAYDYDNVPVWLQNYQQSPAWQAIKPFAKYPYKYSKHIDTMIGNAFDGTKTWQERMASILALGTMVAVYAYIRDKQKKKSKTVPVPESAPSSVSTQGRLYVGTDKDGKEMFTRTSKYPFVNLTEAGMQFAEGNAAQGFQIITDMVGSVAPAGVVAGAVMGYKSKYQQYTPTPVIAGQALASFVPGTRILSDISRFFDPYQRTPETFGQAFTSFYPTTNAELQDKLHGKIRTIKVPLEGEVTPAGDVAGEGKRRTTTDMYVKNYKQDILLGLLGGIYINRIDPNVAEAFSIRAEKSAETKEKADAKKGLSDFYK